MHKYKYQEPHGRELDDAESKREDRRIEIMTECVKNSVTLLTFRIGRHLSGPFQGLYTLEKMVKGRWQPVKDGDLLSQILEDVSLETARVVNDTNK